jgi:PhzF family phenazine biosynthesis protein
VKQLPFKKIDAFAKGQSDGNPAGYIYLNSLSDITSAEMQQIAKELKGFVNEVGFIAQTSEKEFSLKFYSAECEVDFCGHATIAIMYDLIRNNDQLQQFETINIQTNRGKLPVRNRIPDEDAVYIMSPVPVYYDSNINSDTISRALKTDPSTILSNEPVSVINAGLTTLLIPFKSCKAVLDLSPDISELKLFCLQSGIDIIEVFTRDVIDNRNMYRVRVFAPKYGYLEDPATGSGNSAFGYYLIKNKKFDNETISIEQNGDKNRFNIVKLRKDQDTDNNVRVSFGGSAIKRIEGSYFLY